MPTNRRTAPPMLLLAVGGLVVGLAVPAAARQASQLINGTAIRPHSIAGDRLKNNTVTGSQIKESTLGVVPKATVAKTLPPLKWHRLVLDTDWFPQTNERGPAYAVDAQGIVHLRGAMIHGVAGDPAFSLPASVLSLKTYISVPMISGAGSGSDFCTLQIYEDVAKPIANGAEADCGGSDGDDFYDLDGITFAAH